MHANAAFIAAARADVPALVAEVRRLQALVDAVPVDTIRNISLTEARRLNEIDWTPIAAWFDAMDGAEVPTSGFFTSGRWDFTEQPKRIG